MPSTELGSQALTLEQLVKEASDRHELNQLRRKLLPDEVSIVVQYMKNVIKSRTKKEGL